MARVSFFQFRIPYTTSSLFSHSARLFNGVKIGKLSNLESRNVRQPGCGNFYFHRIISPSFLTCKSHDTRHRCIFQLKLFTKYNKPKRSWSWGRFNLLCNLSCLSYYILKWHKIANCYIVLVTFTIRNGISMFTASVIILCWRHQWFCDDAANDC